MIMKLNKLPERQAYGFYIFSSVVDHLSTRLGLTNPWIYETNKLVAYLMIVDLWLPYEIIVTAGLVITMAIWSRRLDYSCRWIALIPPITVGIIRLVVGVCNVMLWSGL